MSSMMDKKFDLGATISDLRAPTRLGPLLSVDFFKPRTVHPYVAKNECNHYCLDCEGKDDAIFCTICIPAIASTMSSWYIQKSSYHEVIGVEELKSVADVSLVQTYVINYGRVVFLNRQPQAPQHGFKCVSHAGACRECGRGVVDASFCFCSLSCKLNGMVSDPNITFIVDPRLNREDSSLAIEEVDEADNYHHGPSNSPSGWISYRRWPRKGVPERAPFY
ncbi:hypothetical protein D1007_43688 [Hordeum vulgare]|nr:hypothetical protein D1007_43688 [Hordeum vulgare]